MPSRVFQRSCLDHKYVTFVIDQATSPAIIHAFAPFIESHAYSYVDSCPVKCLSMLCFHLQSTEASSFEQCLRNCATSKTTRNLECNSGTVDCQLSMIAFVEDFAQLNRGLIRKVFNRDPQTTMHCSNVLPRRTGR